MIGMSCDNLETSRDPYLTGGSKHKKELGTTLDIWEPPKPFDFATQSWTCRLIKLRLEMYINVGFSGSSPVSHRRHSPSLADTSTLPLRVTQESSNTALAITWTPG